MTYRILQQSGVSTARPTATGSGLVYQCSDIPVKYVDDHATKAWKQYVRDIYTPTPTVASSYTVVSTTNLSLAQYADTISARMLVSGVSTAPCALLSGTLSSSGTWVVNLLASMDEVINTTYPGVAIVVTDGTTSGTSNAYGITYWSNGTNHGLHQDQFKVNGTRSSVSNEFSGITFELIRFRLLADGTNLHYQVSYQDGFHWTDIACATTPSSLAYYGFALGNDFTSNSSYTQALIYRNDLTTLTVAQATISTISTANPAIVTTSAAHNFLTGDIVAIHGSSNANFNSGTGVTTAPTAAAAFGWVITVTGTNTFTIPTSSTPSATGGNATLISR